MQVIGEITSPVKYEVILPDTVNSYTLEDVVERLKRTEQ